MKNDVTVDISFVMTSQWYSKFKVCNIRMKTCVNSVGDYCSSHPARGLVIRMIMGTWPGNKNDNGEFVERFRGLVLL